MRRRAAVLAFLFTVVAGCGGDEEKTGALRVDVVIASADGEPPTEGWRLESESGALLPCVIESKGPGHVVISAQGPAGRYGIKTPKGFGIVDLGPKPLTPDLPPVTAFLGREHTLYLTPKSSAWRVVDAIVVPDGEGSRTAHELKSTRDTGADGRLAIRIDPEAWKTKVVLVTALLGPPHADPFPGRYATVSGIKLPADGTPTGVIVEPDSPLPFLVHVLNSSGGEPLSGRSARATILLGRSLDDLGRMSIDHRALTGADGVARFDELPGGSSEMRTHIDIDGESRGIDGVVTDAREQGEARFLAPKPARRSQEHTVLFDGDLPRLSSLTTFLLRPARGASYGRIGFSARPSKLGILGMDFLLAPGTYSLFVRAGDRAATVSSLQIREESGDPTSVTLAPLCTIQGVIVGRIGMGQPLDLFARRMEDGRPVEAEGWVLRRLVRPEFDLMLPTGEWRITAEDAAGKAGPVTDCSFEKPGSRASIKVQAPP